MPVPAGCRWVLWSGALWAPADRGRLCPSTSQRADPGARRRRRCPPNPPWHWQQQQAKGGRGASGGRPAPRPGGRRVHGLQLGGLRAVRREGAWRACVPTTTLHRPCLTKARCVLCRRRSSFPRRLRSEGRQRWRRGRLALRASCQSCRVPTVLSVLYRYRGLEVKHRFRHIINSDRSREQRQHNFIFIAKYPVTSLKSFRIALILLC